MEGLRTIEISGHGTRLLDTGEGEPVVVLHGWGGRIESVAPIIDCLRGFFRVISVDLPGFGESPAPTGIWGTPDYAGFVRGVLAASDVSKAHLVGHSFGAKTSLYLAATDPACVDKLVLAGSSGLRTPPSMRARLKRGLSRTARLAGRAGPAGRRVRDAVYARLASQDYRDAGELRPTFVRIVNEDLAPLLPSVRSSTLLIWGSEDTAAPVAHGRRMERDIPDAGLVLLEGAGHFAYLDEPQRFCRIVRHFLGAPVS